MKHQTIKLVLFSLVTAALVAVPATSRAADAATKAATPEQSAPAAKKERATPFHGKIAAVDTAAMTVTVGSLVLNITSATKITKEGKPATLSDFTVGESVGGSYKKGEDGKLSANMIHTVTPKEKGKGKKKKSE